MQLLFVEVSTGLQSCQFLVIRDVLTFVVLEEGFNISLNLLQSIAEENFFLAEQFLGELFFIWKTFFFSVSNEQLLFIGCNITKES